MLSNSPMNPEPLQPHTPGAPSLDSETGTSAKPTFPYNSVSPIISGFHTQNQRRFWKVATRLKYLTTEVSENPVFRELGHARVAYSGNNQVI